MYPESTNDPSSRPSHWIGVAVSAEQYSHILTTLRDRFPENTDVEFLHDAVIDAIGILVESTAVNFSAEQTETVVRLAMEGVQRYIERQQDRWAVEVPLEQAKCELQQIAVNRLTERRVSDFIRRQIAPLIAAKEIRHSA